MPQLSLGFQALYIALAYLAAIKYCLIALAELLRRKTSQRTFRTQSDDYWEGWLHFIFKVNALQL